MELDRSDRVAAGEGCPNIVLIIVVLSISTQAYCRDRVVPAVHPAIRSNARLRTRIFGTDPGSNREQTEHWPNQRGTQGLLQASHKLLKHRLAMRARFRDL